MPQTKTTIRMDIIQVLDSNSPINPVHPEGLPRPQHERKKSAESPPGLFVLDVPVAAQDLALELGGVLVPKFGSFAIEGRGTVGGNVVSKKA